MTEREVINAIKDGRSFVLTASGPTTAREDVLGDLQRCTAIALSELRGDRDRWRREAEMWKGRAERAASREEDAK